MQLKYGCNPNQKFASVEPLDSRNPPLEVLNGRPGYINFLDALNGWQLVAEVKAALGVVAATSFKHVSPAGAAIATPLSEELIQAYEVGGRELTPSAMAYVRARGADPKSSFGDFAAISDPVDEATARFLKAVVSDGLIAPDYEPAALDILTQKKGGQFIVMRANQQFELPQRETREVYGMKMVQDRNNEAITMDHLKNVVCGELDEPAKQDLILGLITLKYTQSNSVGFSLGGQMIGIGAGQQSRVDCTKLAGGKADIWHLGRHPKVLGLKFKDSVSRQERINFRVRYIEGDLLPLELDALKEALAQPLVLLTEDEKKEWVEKELKGVSLSSDGFIPFRDNIDHAVKHGVRYVAQPGGSSRDEEIKTACQQYGITMVHTGLRLFHH